MKLKRASEKKLTSKDLEGRCNLETKRWVEALLPFESNVVATIGSGYDKGYIKVVDVQRFSRRN